MTHPFRRTFWRTSKAARIRNEDLSGYPLFLWAITADPRLSKAQRACYLDESNDLYFSVVSIWEILIKAGLGKLPIPTPAVDYVVRQMSLNRLNALPVRVQHLAELERLPAIHRDPFDRLLIAQARAETMAILSADPWLRKYEVRVL